MKIVWSREAEENLSEIKKFIEQDSPQRAVQFIKKIKSKTTLLDRFPNLGRLVPELVNFPVQPRELIVEGYRIVYQHRHGRVEIVTVFHGMRLFPGIDGIF